MNPTTLRRRRSQRPVKEALTACAQAVAISTAGWDRGSVRVRFDRLDDDEARELVELSEKCVAGWGVDWTKLGRKDRARWEALVEQAGALGDGFFQRMRDEAKLRSEIGELAREAAKPAAPSVREQERLIALLHAHVRDGILHLDRLAVLVYVLGQLLMAEPIAPGSRLENGGDQITLVLRRDLGLGYAHDPLGRFPKWTDAVKQLTRVGWLASESNGNELRVRLGPRALRALGRTK
jgi:hypothetical protein